MNQNIGHRIREVLFENPTKEFHIRSIARELKIPKSTVNYYVKDIIKEGLVVKKIEGVFPSIIANEISEKYRFYKKQHALERLFESKIIEYLEGFYPKCIILFGSFAKGEYDKESDIDIFMQCSDEKINLNIFEKRLKHKINILFEPNIMKLSPELLNNIINGTKLRGYVTIKNERNNVLGDVHKKPYKNSPNRL